MKKNIKKYFKSLLVVLILFFYNTQAFSVEINYKKDIEYDDYLDYGMDDEINQNIYVWDPLEKINRKVYKFNEFVLRDIAKPFYYNIYTKITTPGIRKSIGNVLNNLRMPINFFNYVLQLDFRNAMASLYNFAINTVYGVGGIFDVAGHQKVFVSDTNLGITLAKYKMPAGPYLVLPN